MFQSILQTSPAGSGWSIGAWTILIGCLSAIPAALIGVFLCLRRMSLLADAISHAVLPGIAIAFMVSGQVSGLPIVVGAVIAAFLTTTLTRIMNSSGKVNEQAGIGVVFTTLFALGVMLISIAAENVDLDPGCILYGAIEFVPLDTVTFNSFEFPRSMLPQGLAAIITGVFIVLFFKELKLCSFDYGLADSMGFHPSRLDIILLVLTSTVTVFSFEAVGSILVIVLLVAPASAALLMSDKLEVAMPLAVLFGCLSSISGYFAALSTNTSVAGMIAISAGVIFIATWLFSPGHGEIANIIRRLKLRLSIATDDLLAAYFRRQFSQKDLSISFENPKLRSRFWRTLAQHRAIRKGWLASESNQGNPSMYLTDQGLELAKSIVRSHRLWESFLHQDFQLPEDHLHEPAELAEHFLGPDLQTQLSFQLEKPKIDPHGSQIP